MRSVTVLIILIVALVVPTTASAHRGHHHHKNHRHHLVAKKADDTPVELEIVSVGPEYTPTSEELIDDQVAVEAYEGNTFGEPPTTLREEETPMEPEG
jgi:hypothetical protein